MTKALTAYLTCLYPALAMRETEVSVEIGNDFESYIENLNIMANRHLSLRKLGILDLNQ